MIIIKKFIDVFKNFLLIGSYLIYTIFAFIPILIFNLDMDNLPDSTKHLLTVFSGILYMIIIIIIYRKSLKKELKEFKDKGLSLINRNIRYYLIGLIVMMFSNIFISIMINRGAAVNEQIVQEELHKAPLYMIYSACIFAPFIEEILFRKTLRNVFPTNIVFIIMSGLLFGYIHTLANATSPTELLYIIPCGAVGSMFALMYVKEENIFVPILFHAFHNTILVIMSLLLH